MSYTNFKLRFFSYVFTTERNQVPFIWNHKKHFSHTPSLSERQLRPNSTTSALIEVAKKIIVKKGLRTPKAILVHIIREQFPLKTMFRADILRGANFLYDDLLEQINVEEFLNDFKLPDTFDSWFKVIELHIFILSARLMKEDKLGLVARDYLWNAFWKDVEYRYCRMSPVCREYEKVEFKLFRRVSKYMFAAYDEGLQSDDKVLASALWRRFFAYECDNAMFLERLVKYIRHELDYQSKIQFRDFLQKKHEWFIPLSKVRVVEDLNAPKIKYIC